MCTALLAGTFISAVLWFEARTDRPAGERFGGSEPFKRSIDRSQSELAAEGTTASKAPRFLTCMIVSLELIMVGDMAEARAVRVTAW